MTTAIKKNRAEGTKSNKKAPLITSTSNKSLKNLRENTHNFKVGETSKKKDKENREEEKKGTIMVKNIKNKIVGNNPISSKITNPSKKI